MEAGTDFVLEVGGGLSRDLQLPRPCLKSFVPGSLSAISIDDGVTEQTIEPCNSRFVRLEVVPVLKGTQIRSLKNVLC